MAVPCSSRLTGASAKLKRIGQRWRFENTILPRGTTSATCRPRRWIRSPQRTGHRYLPADEAEGKQYRPTGGGASGYQFRSTSIRRRAGECRGDGVAGLRDAHSIVSSPGKLWQRLELLRRRIAFAAWQRTLPIDHESRAAVAEASNQLDADAQWLPCSLLNHCQCPQAVDFTHFRIAGSNICRHAYRHVLPLVADRCRDTKKNLRPLWR